MSLKLVNPNESGIKTNITKIGEYKFEPPLKHTDILTGKTVITHASSLANFKIVASPTGITVKGEIELTNQTELQQFALLISEMWTNHAKLQAGARSEILNA